MKSFIHLKFNLIFLSLASLFILSSCNEDPEPPPVVQMTPEEMLTGSPWLLVESEYTSDNTNNIFGTPITAYNYGVLQNSSQTFTFTSNPNEYTVTGNYDIFLTVGTIPNDPNPDTQTITNQSWESGQWILDGDSLTIFNSDTSAVAYLETLSETEMKFNIDYFIEFYDGLATQDLEGYWRFERF